jgi:hypothetical protein
MGEMGEIQYSSGSRIVVAGLWPLSSAASVMIQILTPFSVE